jgi:hypothetical protein
MQNLESVVQELLELYTVSAPPIPIERMLQHPHPDMWEDVDLNEFSSTFLSVSTPFAPRMSLARFLARHIAKSPWGRKRGLDGIDENEQIIHSFARVLVMPGEFVMEITETSRTPQIISLHFEVPEDDALLRLQDLKTYSG